MNWWHIIKNQVASTKGKTFQLDFSQPMVDEEEKCKERLMKFGKFLAGLGYGSAAIPFGSEIRINKYNNLIDSISEDIACNMIEELMNLEKAIKSLRVNEEDFIERVTKYTYNYRGLSALASYWKSDDGRDDLYIVYDYNGITTEIDCFGIMDYPYQNIFKLIRENL